ncbi:MAG: nucleoside hydrolase [Acidobacteria bacterium]|nr:nucleoside hydrolase [Acidobacteriota bacterium]
MLLQSPELADRIVRVVAVAGRRPDQRFTTGTTNTKGHRDFNFELDPEAFRVLLKSGLPLVLTPFEISSKIWIQRADLDRLASRSRAGKTLAGPAHGWLDLWQQLFGVDGFNPFDTLAFGYVISADGFACDTLPVDMLTLPDDVTEPGVQGTAVASKPFLIASSTLAAASTTALSCSDAPPDFKRDLLARLSR